LKKVKLGIDIGKAYIKVALSFLEKDKIIVNDLFSIPYKNYKKTYKLNDKNFLNLKEETLDIFLKIKDKINKPIDEVSINLGFQRSFGDLGILNTFSNLYEEKTQEELYSSFKNIFKESKKLILWTISPEELAFEVLNEKFKENTLILDIGKEVSQIYDISKYLTESKQIHLGSYDIHKDSAYIINTSIKKAEKIYRDEANKVHIASFYRFDEILELLLKDSNIDISSYKIAVQGGMALLPIKKLHEMEYQKPTIDYKNKIKKIDENSFIKDFIFNNVKPNGIYLEAISILKF
jgi:hypothetical protein